MEYQKENKTCQNCKKDFTIEPDDFSFYEKIKVPPPTWCSECRLARRMMWRNFRSLFKRNCGKCDKSLISMYPEGKIKKVYCMDCWNSDERDPFIQGMDYDFQKNFFDQIKILIATSPFVYIYHTSIMAGSDFTNYSANDKDCYLSFSIVDCENIYYSEIIDKSKNSFDNYAAFKIENCSYNINSDNNFNCHFLVESSKCIDSYFLYDCVNCQNCCLSYNLRNQQYVFLNKKLSKEEYERKLEELKIKTYSGFKKIEEIFNNLVKSKVIHRHARIINSSNCTGDYIINSRDIRNSFDVQNSENLFNISRAITNVKDCYDCVGIISAELVYESVATSFSAFKDYFCYISTGCRNCEYCFVCRNCIDCFGCIGLTNSQYCILNKQFDKDQYYQTVEKIKKHMDDVPYIDNKNRVYRYGEFFPPDMTPFAYNLSTANDFLPSNQESVLKMGYPWNNRAERIYEATIGADDLLDNIQDVGDDILNETITCPNNGDQNFQCSSAYRVTSFELQFYRQKKLPIPRYCPNCRHYQRLRFRNPIKLYNRQCMKEGCNNEFKTSYSSDRPEIVYCEKCYQQEVY